MLISKLNKHYKSKQQTNLTYKIKQILNKILADGTQ